MSNIKIKYNNNIIKNNEFIKIIQNSDFYLDLEIQKEIGTNFSILYFKSYLDFECKFKINSLINIIKTKDNISIKIPLENNFFVCDYEDDNYIFKINIKPISIEIPIIIEYGPIKITKKFYEIKNTIINTTIYHNVNIYFDNIINIQYKKLLWRDNNIFISNDNFDKSIIIKPENIIKLNKLREFPYKISILFNNKNIIIEFGSFTEKQTINSLIEDQINNSSNNLKCNKNPIINLNKWITKKYIEQIMKLNEDNLININKSFKFLSINYEIKFNIMIEKLIKFQKISLNIMGSLKNFKNNYEINNDLLKFQLNKLNKKLEDKDIIINKLQEENNNLKFNKKNLKQKINILNTIFKNWDNCNNNLKFNSEKIFNNFDKKFIYFENSFNDKFSYFNKKLLRIHKILNILKSSKLILKTKSLCHNYKILKKYNFFDLNFETIKSNISVQHIKLSESNSKEINRKYNILTTKIFNNFNTKNLNLKKNFKIWTLNIRAVIADNFLRNKNLINKCFSQFSSDIKIINTVKTLLNCEKNEIINKIKKIIEFNPKADNIQKNWKLLKNELFEYKKFINEDLSDLNNNFLVNFLNNNN